MPSDQPLILFPWKLDLDPGRLVLSNSEFRYLFGWVIAPGGSKQSKAVFRKAVRAQAQKSCK